MTNKLFYALIAFFSLVISGSADAQGWGWAKSGSGDENDIVNSIATDASGNTYVTGIFKSTSITFGSTTLTNSGVGYYDMFLVKYNPSGAVVWAKGFGGTSDDASNSVTTDPAGNVYIAGDFNSPSITFGSYSFTTPYNGDYFIAKLNPSGTVLWATTTGDSFNIVNINSIAIGKGGSIYATGSYSNSLTIGSTVLTNASTFGYHEDIFIVKYNVAGTFQWARSIGDSKDEIGPSLAADTMGNIYIAGTFTSPSLTIGSSTISNMGFMDMFYAKYDSTGSVLWVRSESAGVYLAAVANSITADAAGNVYVAGRYTEPSLTFGSITITNAGFHTGDGFLLKSNTAGSVLWAKGLGGIYDDEVKGVHADNNGNVFIVGNFSDTIHIGTTTLFNAAGGGVFAAKYTTAGTAVYAVGVTPTASVDGRAISSDPAGNNLYVAGDFTGDSCSFGTISVYNSAFVGYTETFVAKYQGVTTSVSENTKMQGGLNVFPNPSTGQMTVQMNNGTFNKVVIYDHIGRVVYSAETELADKSKTIDLSGNANGLYFVVVSGADSYSTGTFELAR